MRITSRTIRARVWVDGVEVSNECFEADNEEGWADCFVRHEGGQGFIVEDGEPKKIRLYGLVKIEVGDER